MLSFYQVSASETQHHLFLKCGLNAKNYCESCATSETTFAFVFYQKQSPLLECPIFLTAYDVLISTSLKSSAFAFLNHSA